MATRPHRDYLYQSLGSAKVDHLIMADPNFHDVLLRTASQETLPHYDRPPKPGKAPKEPKAPKASKASKAAKAAKRPKPAKAEKEPRNPLNLLDTSETAPKIHRSKKERYQALRKKIGGWRRIPHHMSMPSVPQPLVRMVNQQRTVTISIEKEIVRVVVFKGHKIVAWKSAPIEENSVSAHDANLSQEESFVPDLDTAPEMAVYNPLGKVLNELGIHKSGTLGQFLGKFGIRRGRLLMDLSLYTTLMRRLQLTRKVQGHYLRPVVIAEILDSVPFSQQEIDITWDLQKNAEGQEVFAIALPKHRIDSQVKMVKETAMPPVAAYSKAAVLALSAGVPDVIVVHLEASLAAIVLVNGHEPKMVHQIPLATHDINLNQQVEALTKAIEQVASYQLSSASSDEDQLLQVIITGQGSADGNPLAAELRNRLPHEVVPFSTLVEGPEDFPASEFAANLGLFLVDRAKSRAKVAAPTAKRLSLNLLPERHALRSVPVFPTIVFVTLFLLAIHPANVSEWVNDKTAEAKAAGIELRLLQKQEVEYDLGLGEYEESQLHLETVANQIGVLATQMETLDGEADDLVARLETLINTAVPAGVGITAVVPQGAGFVIPGSTSNYTLAFEYAANIESSPLFDSHVEVLEMKGSGSGVKFQFKAFPAKPEEEEDNAEGDVTVAAK